MQDILNELDFFLTDCAVGAVLNFVLIWLLAPTVAAKAGPGPFAAQLSKLPAFVFESGQFTLGQRAGAGLYKGSLFGACGFLGSVGGTSLAYMIFMARQAAAGGEAKKKELQDLLDKFTLLNTEKQAEKDAELTKALLPGKQHLLLLPVH